MYQKTSACAIAFLLIGILSVIPSVLNAQDLKEDKKILIRSLVDTRTYILRVQSVTPMKGGTRQLTPGYTLKVLADSVIADLPYFGRAYQATPGTTDGGIKFISTDFEYSTKSRKKGGWDVEVKPKDQRNYQSLYITVSEDGYTTVNINCIDRQPISYYGYIEAVQKL